MGDAGGAMTVSAEPVLRVAEHDDVRAICRFGVAYVRRHYAPLIGAAAADGQVRSWWNEPDVQAADARGLVVVRGGRRGPRRRRTARPQRLRPRHPQAL